MASFLEGARLSAAARAAVATEPAFLGNAELARKYGVSYRTIGNIRRQFGVAPNPRGIPPGLKIKTTRSHNGKPLGWPFKPSHPRALLWAL